MGGGLCAQRSEFTIYARARRVSSLCCTEHLSLTENVGPVTEVVGPVTEKLRARAAQHFFSPLWLCVNDARMHAGDGKCARVTEVVGPVTETVGPVTEVCTQSLTNISLKNSSCTEVWRIQYTKWRNQYICHSSASLCIWAKK